MQQSIPSAQLSASSRASSHPMQAKRKRKTLSCNECRRRKLKCDREEPSCSRCRKAGNPELCSYIYDVSSLSSNREPSHTPRVFPRSLSVSQHLDSTTHGIPSQSQQFSTPRVAPQFLDISGKEYAPLSTQATQNPGTWQLLGHVSLATKGAEQRPTISDIQNAAADSQQSIPKETVIFQGENFRTQYYGGSNATSSIAHFPELRSFMKETIHSQTTLPAVQRELKSLQVKWKSIKADNAWHLAHDELLQLLPDRETTDRYVNLYFNSVEATYRILHYQTFQKQYESLWQDPQHVSSAVVIILLLVMASVDVLLIHEQPKYIGDSSLSRERAFFWIEVSEKWLTRQSYKHTHLATWQVRCLIIYAKHINVMKKKRIWTEAGTLLRQAMSAGFHRDPGVLGDKVSFFDQEMRRRLWATIIEMELQISIDRGMPSASAGLPSDTATVLNIHDDELENGSRPTSRPILEHTSTSYLHISRSSFSLRVSLNSMVNDLSSPLTYENVLDYEDMITKELQRIPSRLVNPSQAQNDERSTRNQTTSRSSLSRMTCLTAAAEIVNMYSDLVATGNCTILLHRNDYFRAALVICQNTYTNLSLKHKPADNVFINLNSATLTRRIEDVLGMLEQRIRQHGTGYTYYWYISAAFAFLQSVLVPSERVRLKEEAIKRVTEQYCRVLESQEDINTARDMIMPIGLKNTIPCKDLTLPNESADATGLASISVEDEQLIQSMDLPLDEFFFGNPAAWTFDNLWGTIE